MTGNEMALMANIAGNGGNRMTDTFDDKHRPISVLKYKKLTETAKEPTRGSTEAAGYDLYVDSAEVTEIKPHETVMFSTGLAMEIPDGCYGAIFARSGISSREGLRPATCVSVIDSDYRGNVGLPVHNDSDEVRYIQPYERVAQIIVQRYDRVMFVETDALDETDRGEDGFGSSGK